LIVAAAPSAAADELQRLVEHCIQGDHKNVSSYEAFGAAVGQAMQKRYDKGELAPTIDRQ